MRSGTGTNCAWYTRQDASTCLATSHLPSSVRSCLPHCACPVPNAAQPLLKELVCKGCRPPDRQEYAQVPDGRDCCIHKDYACHCI